MLENQDAHPADLSHYRVREEQGEPRMSTFLG